MSFPVGHEAIPGGLEVVPRSRSSFPGGRSPFLGQDFVPGGRMSFPGAGVCSQRTEAHSRGAGAVPGGRRVFPRAGCHSRQPTTPFPGSLPLSHSSPSSRAPRGGGGHSRGRPGGGFGGRSQEIGSCQPGASGPWIREAVPGGMRLPVSLWLPLALGVAAVAAGQSPLQRRVVREVLEYFHGRSNVQFLFKEREVDGVIERVSNGIRDREPGLGRRDGHGNGEGAGRGCPRGNGEGDGVSRRGRAVERVIEGGEQGLGLGSGIEGSGWPREQGGGQGRCPAGSRW